jgi:hypothetical protein
VPQKSPSKSARCAGLGLPSWFIYRPTTVTRHGGSEFDPTTALRRPQKETFAIVLVRNKDQNYPEERLERAILNSMIARRR